MHFGLLPCVVLFLVFLFSIFDKNFSSFTATDNDRIEFGDRVLTVYPFKHQKIVVATHIGENKNKHWYSSKLGWYHWIFLDAIASLQEWSGRNSVTNSSWNPYIAHNIRLYYVTNSSWKCIHWNIYRCVTNSSWTPYAYNNIYTLRNIEVCHKLILNIIGI